MPIFVVHKHAARRLHYDLRLEMKNRAGRKLLKSWAVPKEPPGMKGIKRLAVAVEDHDFSYRNFEGVIKEGYGKGIVKIWDSGRYKPISCRKDKIVFSLAGKKLKGEYVLLKFRDRNWLFFKK
ncbi:MAG: DNA polymerase ligase N-terminal domain-containing protein [Candidatus Aenigmarchaeota archaeon]|nr:DNA polymerase ligase N-terminal domain-containing protein [Candidatus Aenigmarchaeota archaeon]MDI6722654.1 DNA polymerase ligase N-terminal domain-containing protein [Candidatus Aenigmarchaeota archaeon]